MWSAITITDIEDARHAELVRAARTQALGIGQADPLQSLIKATTDEVRGCIAEGGRAVDMNPTTLPENLKPLAVAKIGRALKQRLNIPLSQADQDEERTYQQRLEKLVAGKWPVNATDTPTETATASASKLTGAELANYSIRRATRTSLSGL